MSTRPTILNFRVSRAARQTWRAPFPVMVAPTYYGSGPHRHVNGLYARLGTRCLGICWMPRRTKP